MSGKQRQMAAEIQAAIANGTLTYDEIERRLLAAIDAEMAKDDTPADMALVRACEDLLWTMQHGDEAIPDTRYELNLATAQKKLAKHVRRQNMRQITLRTVAVVAAILVIALGIDLATQREWLEGSSTSDEQQYQVQGVVVDSGLVPSGSAKEEEDYGSLETDKFDEAAAFLGFSPLMPSYVPEGWTISRYYVSKYEDFKQIRVQYINAASIDQNLLYTVSLFESAEDAYAAFEQNGEGTQHETEIGDIYLSQNVDRNRCFWIEGMMTYSLVGLLDSGSLEQIAISTKGDI